MTNDKKMRNLVANALFGKESANNIAHKAQQLIHSKATNISKEQKELNIKLFEAAKNMDYDEVCKLLDAGANPTDSVNDDGTAAMTYIAKMHEKMQMEAGENVTPQISNLLRKMRHVRGKK